MSFEWGIIEFFLARDCRFWRMGSMILSKLRLWLVIAAVSSPVLASAEINQLTEVERKDGWRLLFDGKSFEG